MTHRRLLTAICAAYVLLASLYSIVVPIFEASDELWHYPMVKYLADNGLQLPPQDPANPGAWRQEGSQPPLYYILAALLTAGIDTSDMDYVRRINPHADIGVVRPDGNANMIVHRTEAESFPWRGTVLAVHVARFFSVALGLGTVLVTYQLAREIFPNQTAIQLGATALVAFLPMFLFISGSVNNDNLSNFLGNLLTLLIVRLLKMSQRPHWRVYVILGIVAGAGLLAKFNIGFLLPIVALALLILSLRLRDWRPFILGGAISGTLTIAIAGWWYWRNLQLYGDPTGLNRFLEMVGRRAVPANAAQLWSERHSFTQSFWGFFGGMNVPMPEPVYLIFNLIGGLALLSALTFIIYHGVRYVTSKNAASSVWGGNFLPAAVTLIWPALTFISYLRWTAETPASQGRLMFAALSSIMLWMAVGLTWRSRVMLVAVVVFFAVIAVLVPFQTIQAAYALPNLEISSDAPQTIFRTPNDQGEIAMIGQASDSGLVVFRENYAPSRQRWQIVTPPAQDWTLFHHLVTPDGVIVGQRDVYPGGGLLATSDMTAGQAWFNETSIWIPATAYTPMLLDVQVGWYNRLTGERMTLADGSETLTIGQVQLTGNIDAEIPNPLAINFGDLLELVGYSLTDLSPTAGATVELTLYWRALQTIPDDYKVFANIIDPRTLTKYAASDGMPVQWTRPTTTWTPGEIIEDTHTLNVSVDSPPGIYELELGLYREAPDGSRLRIFTPDGGQSDNFIYLSRVRILPLEEAS